VPKLLHQVEWNSRMIINAVYSHYSTVLKVKSIVWWFQDGFHQVWENTVNILSFFSAKVEWPSTGSFGWTLSQLLNSKGLYCDNYNSSVLINPVEQFLMIQLRFSPSSWTWFHYLSGLLGSHGFTPSIDKVDYYDL